MTNRNSNVNCVDVETLLLFFDDKKVEQLAIQILDDVKDFLSNEEYDELISAIKKYL